jgi:hypothetical protein
MRGKAMLIAVVTAVLTVVLGCHHDKHDLSYTPKEECVLPPHQPRFDSPPSAAFQKRRPKPEEKSLMDRGGQMGPSPLGGPGF